MWAASVAVLLVISLMPIKTEFASSTAANIASAFGGQLGMAGKIDANSLQQMTKGRVFNPFAEQIFKSMAFRQHAFNFKMYFSRSHKRQEGCL